MKCQITQEVPGKVDGQDDGQRQKADQCHEQDDVTLEGQVGDGVNPTLTTDLLVPAETQQRGNCEEGV